MKKHIFYLNYAVILCLTIFLIQCSDVMFKGDRNANRSSSNNGELTKAADVIEGDLGISETEKKYDDSIESVKPTEPVRAPVSENDTTFLTLQQVPDVTIGMTVNITGFLKDNNGQGISNASIKIKINGDVISTPKTDSNGDFSFSFKAKKAGSYNVKVSYEEDDTHKGADDSKTFNVFKIETNLSISSTLLGVKKGDSIDIRGLLVAEDKTHTPIEDANVEVSINNSKQTVKTNSLGEYLRTGFQVTNTGSYNVVVSYAGNEIYNESKVSTEFMVATVPVVIKNTSLSLDPINNVLVGKSAIIKGILKDSSQTPISNASVKLSINGVLYPISKTDTQGKFRYDYPVNSAGTYTVKVSYEGEPNKYNGSEIYGSFTASVPKIDTSLELKVDRIEVGRNFYYLGENVVIHGSLYKNGNVEAVQNAKINLKINNNLINQDIRTNENGHFEYNYQPKAVGTYKVTVSYAGDELHNASNDDSDTFDVVDKMVADIVIQASDITFGQDELISVTLPQSVGSVDMEISEIEPKFTLPLEKGVGKHTVTNPAIGKYQITVSFAGNNKYKAGTVTKQFQVNPVPKQDSRFELNDIKTVYVGEDVVISGKLVVDATGEPVKEATVNLKVIEDQARTQTDSLGNFSFNYKTYVANHYIAKLSFDGNADLNSTEENKGFEVKQLSGCTEIQLSFSSNSKVSSGPNGKGSAIQIEGEIFDNCYKEMSSGVIGNAVVDITISFENKVIDTYRVKFNSYGRTTNGYRVDEDGESCSVSGKCDSGSFDYITDKTGELHFLVEYKGTDGFPYEPAMSEETVMIDK